MNEFIGPLLRKIKGIVSFPNRFEKWILLYLIIIGLPFQCFALDPEPRNWNHLPIDRNFGGFAFALIEADIFFDPTLLLEDVEMTKDAWVARYLTCIFHEKVTLIEIRHIFSRS